MILTSHSKSQIEVQEVLKSERASIILEKVVDDASSISLSDCRSSRISNFTVRSKEDAVVVTEVDPKDFSFDQEVLITPAYRRVRITSDQASRHIASVAEYQNSARSISMVDPRSQDAPMNTSPPTTGDVKKEADTTDLLAQGVIEEDVSSKMNRIPRKALPDTTNQNGPEPSGSPIDPDDPTSNTEESTFHSQSDVGRAESSTDLNSSSLDRVVSEGETPVPYSSISHNLEKLAEVRAERQRGGPGEKRLTLGDFMLNSPQYSFPVNWSRRKNFWAAPNELRITGQGTKAQIVPGDAVAIRTSLRLYVPLSTLPASPTFYADAHGLLEIGSAHVRQP